MHKKWRKFFNDIHLWFGLLSGTVLFIVCLSGTVYTFHKEINEFFNREKYIVEATGKMLPAEDILAGVQNEKQKVTNVVIPADARRSWTLSVVDKAKKNKDEKARPKQLLVNPYSGKILGSTESTTNDFFLVVMKLHRWLLMVQAGGRIVVGLATIIFSFLIFTGLLLWVPRKIKRWKNWKKGLQIKFSARWKRINHDLHNTLGFYAFLLLLVMALTGLCWSFDWYRNSMSNMLGDKVFKQRDEKPLSSAFVANARPVSLSEALSVADKALPFKGNISVSLPADSVGAYNISKTRDGFFDLSVPDKVVIDMYTGKVIKLEKFADKKFTHQVAASIRPLHTGEIFGTFSKILYFIACLIATSLPVTGTIIWLNKIRKPKKVRRETAN